MPRFQEQLRLCAEQSVLRAQTRATIALANQPRPLSFCSVMAFKGFTYLPPFKGSEHRVGFAVSMSFFTLTMGLRPVELIQTSLWETLAKLL